MRCPKTDKCSNTDCHHHGEHRRTAECSCDFFCQLGHIDKHCEVSTVEVHKETWDELVETVASRNLVMDDIEVFRLCANCNKEYQIECDVIRDDMIVSAMENCPYCGKLDHVWVKIVKTIKTIKTTDTTTTND